MRDSSPSLRPRCLDHISRTEERSSAEIAGASPRARPIIALFSRCVAPWTTATTIALVGLLLGGVGDDDAAGGLLIGLDAANDHPVVQGGRNFIVFSLRSGCEIVMILTGRVCANAAPRPPGRRGNPGRGRASIGGARIIKNFGTPRPRVPDASAAGLAALLQDGCQDIDSCRKAHFEGLSAGAPVASFDSRRPRRGRTLGRPAHVSAPLGGASWCPGDRIS